MVGKVISVEERRGSIVVALLGQPNVGKSTLYNRLTGADQRIGNWPGKTVEIAWSKLKLDSKQIILVDLPGTYSLSGFTEEEEVAVRFIVEEKPDVIVVITDVSALARNLYLLLQAMELTNRVVLVVNMLDEAQKWGISVDLDALSRILNIPVVGTVAIRGIGVRNVLKAAIAVAENPPKPRRIDYNDLEKHIFNLTELLSKEAKDVPPRFLALQLIDNYEKASAALSESVKVEASKILEEIRREYRRDPSITLSSIRYKIIDDILLRVFMKRSLSDRLTEKLDQIILRKGFDILVSVAVLFGGFYLAFSVGKIAVEILEYFLEEHLLNPVNLWLSRIIAVGWLYELIVDGLLRGFSLVLLFVPLIFTFSFIFSLIENTGFLARMALALDRAFLKFDMSGKASFPMISSLACNVVGVITARIVPSAKERLRIMVTSQFVQCPARQVVLAILLGLVFPPLIASAVLIIYVILGFILALLVSKMLKKLEGKARIETPIELPPYRLPALGIVAKIAWRKSIVFIKRAGILIAVANVVFWLLLNLPPGAPPSNSIIGMIGKAIAVVFHPIGLEWKETVSLIVGFIAKELTIGVMNLLYEGYSMLTSAVPLPSLIAFLTIYAYYTPCLATIAAIRTESGSIKTAAKAIIMSLTIALILGYASYFIVDKLLPIA